MIKFNFFTASGTPTFELGFNNPSVEYKESLGWVVLNAAGRTITLAGTSTLAYDDEIFVSAIHQDLLNIAQNEINSAYKDSDKIMVVFSQDQVPVRILHGKTLKFISQYNNLTTFAMDDKPIWIYNMNYFIISKN